MCLLNVSEIRDALTASSSNLPAMEDQTVVLEAESALNPAKKRKTAATGVGELIYITFIYISVKYVCTMQESIFFLTYLSLWVFQMGLK